MRQRESLGELVREGRVATDLPCAGCGYNLRTLAIDGQCPECGLGVRRSTRRRRLLLLDRGWLSSTASGATLLAATAWILTVLIPSAIVLIASPGWAGLVVDHWSLRVIIMAAWCLGALLLLRRPTDEMSLWRRRRRGALMTLIGSTALFVAAPLLYRENGDWLLPFWLGALLAGYFLAYRHLIWLVRYTTLLNRLVQRRDFARVLRRIALFGVLICAGLFVASASVELATAGTRFRLVNWLFEILMLAASVFAAVFLGVLSIMLTQLARGLWAARGAAPESTKLRAGTEPYHDHTA